MIRVHLVDDHDIVRAGLKRLLEDQDDIEVVAESDSGESALYDYSRHNPDILILDLVMPGIGGFEVIRRTLARDPHARILVLSFHEHEIIPQRVLAAGAHGYLTKGAEPSLLIQAVHQIHAGGTFIEPALAQKLAARDHRDESRVLLNLSPREFEIFLMLAEGHSVAGIAEILHLSPKTVGNHHHHIMKKLNVSNKAELVRLAVLTGLINA